MNKMSLADMASMIFQEHDSGLKAVLDHVIKNSDKDDLQQIMMYLMVCNSHAFEKIALWVTCDGRTFLTRKEYKEGLSAKIQENNEFLTNYLTELPKAEGAMPLATEPLSDVPDVNDIPLPMLFYGVLLEVLYRFKRIWRKK